MPMTVADLRPWARNALLFGVLYAAVGIAFAVPVTHVKAWRLAAWVVSALGFAAHIAFERLRLQNTSRSVALHAAVAVAIGAFGLAVGANIHSLSTASTGRHRQLLLPSLVIWPVMTALPAFLVALCMSSVLGRAFRGAPGK